MKKTLSLMLCVLMLITVIPFSALADPTGPAFVVNDAAVEAGQGVTLDVRAVNAAEVAALKFTVNTPAGIDIVNAYADDALAGYKQVGPIDDPRSVTFVWANGEGPLNADDVVLFHIEIESFATLAAAD